MITENYEAYADGGTQKDFRISLVGEETVIENSNMLTESIKLDEALCSDENLRFGCCEASQFTVQVANVFDNFEGKKLAVTVTMDEETTKYGTFKVLSDKPTADRVWRTITAYDAMRDIINADVLEWYNALTFPMTIRAFRDSFFNHLGITQKAVTLINDSFQVQQGFSATGSLSGKTIITAICEFNGVFGHINRDGNFDYVSLDSASSFNCPPYENNSVTYEDYVTEAITKVTMRGTANDVGTSVGVDGNEYIITNNPLIYGTEGTQTLVTAITNLLNKISQVTFRPYSLGKTIGNPCVELGDSITISTRYQTINSYVIKRVLSGIQALRDSYSATGYKVYPKEVNSIQEQINRTQGKMNELSRTVDETVSTVTRVEQIAEDAQETADGLVDDIATANQNAQTALNNSNRAIVTDTLHYLATPLSSGVTTETAGWTTTTQSITETNKYLWTYHTYTYADNHTADTTPVISGVYGNKGEQGQAGQQGEQGEDGIGIIEVTPLYYVSNSSTVPSAPSSEVTTTTTTSYNTWTKGIPAMTTTYKYMFTCDQVKYTNNTFAWTTPVLDNALSTAFSEIKQMADQIVLKVDNNGNVVQVALSSDASTGSNVLIKGDNIQLDGNVTITSGFRLNAGVIQSQNYVAGTSGTKINLTDGLIDSTNVTITGNLTFKDSLSIFDTRYDTEVQNIIKLDVTQTDGHGSPTAWTYNFYTVDGSDLITTGFRQPNTFHGDITGSATNATNATNATYASSVGNKDATDKNSVNGNGWYSVAESKNNVSPGGNYHCLAINWYWGIDIRTGNIGWLRLNGNPVISSAGGTINGNLNLSGNYAYKLNNRAQLYDIGSNVCGLCADGGTTVRKYSSINAYAPIYASAFSQQSSKLVKENIKPITEDDARKLLNIEVVSFDYIKEVGGEKNKVGMIAEDVLKIYPELVNVPENYSEEKAKESIYEGNNTETLGLDYAKFTPYLIKMVQMQQKEIDDLKKLIKTEE